MLPDETILALFPRPPVPVRLGWRRTVWLRPPTLADATAMEAAGCSLLDAMSDAQSLMAAWILALPPSELGRVARGDLAGARGFARVAVRRIGRIAAVVGGLAADAIRPFVPPGDAGRAPAFSDGLPDGYGWPLEVAEALCAHYGWGLAAALATPVQTALALMSVGRGREGGEAGGPDYFGRIRIRRLKDAGIIKERGNG